MTLNEPSSQALLSIGQASRMLGVSDVALRQWTDEGVIEAFITPGGHRRYSEVELSRFMGAGTRVQGIRDVVANMEMAPAREREIAEREFAGMAWYAGLDAGSRMELGRLGRRVYEIVIQYVTMQNKRDETLPVARELGAEFGKRLVEMGLPLRDAMEAFMRHRAPLVETANELIKKRKPLNARAAEAIALVTRITDEILLSLVEAYQGGAKGNGG